MFYFYLFLLAFSNTITAQQLYVYNITNLIIKY